MTVEVETDADVTIEATGLTKTYGDFAAIRDVSFAVRRTQVTAFVGPNGAGKSTTMRILTGYLTPSAGGAAVLGLDVAEHRLEVAARVGYLPENGPLDPEMTPLSFLRFLGHARGLSRTRVRERVDAVVSLCALDTVIEKPIRKLSKGFRQRVGLAQALLHDPEILILDEPTSGLDPNQIREVRRLIRELGKTKTILLSTHILQEVEAVAEHVLLINEGRLTFDGTLAAMLRTGEALDEAFYRLTGAGDDGPQSPVEPTPGVPSAVPPVGRDTAEGEP
jgi:ABC-2 type transport system ATP-binding protein